MGAADLVTFWNRHFGAMAPLGFRLRTNLPERWARVHSLPGSQRYPRTPEQLAEVLRRMNAVADATLGAETTCWLVTAEEYLDERGCLGALPGLPMRARMVAADVETALGEPVVYRGVPLRWRAGELDALLESIAHDVERALFASIATGAVFAPYDGGADVIAPSTVERDALRATFAAWLSPRADGL